MEANKFIEKWTKIVYYFLSEIATPCVMSGFIILSYVLYFIVDSKKEAFYLPFATWYEFFSHIISSVFYFFSSLDRFPFDWRNPIGYFVAIALVTPAFYYAPLIIICDLFFVFGTCKLLATMANDIETELKTLKKLPELNRNIHKIMKMHSTFKQLSSK